MAYLGHFPDQGPPDESWTDEPEPDHEPEPDNVRSFDFTRKPSEDLP